MRSVSLVAAIILAPSIAQAEPLSLDRWLVQDVGVNHHVGDAGFRAVEGRAPTRSDSEHVRMATHLSHIREVLGASAPTRPELAARRNALLGHLDAYIERGITPENTHFGFRTPVFIDDDGRICAVGYLIEQTSGRALAEDIARTNHYSELEAIYEERADVRAWVDGSGFTLTELASIQPGYVAEIDAWHGWQVEEGKITTEPSAAADDEGRVSFDDAKGKIVDGRMEGAWTVSDAAGTVRGSGTFHAGAGTWKSVDAAGRKMGEGPFENNVPHGTWHLYHPSGRVAAVGAFTSGRRTGQWAFYQDKPGDVLVARGSFDSGGLHGKWNHYDENGKLLAMYTEAIPPPLKEVGSMDPKSGTSGIAHLVTVTPGADGVSHSRSFAMEYMNARGFALDMYARGDLKMFVHAEPSEESFVTVMKDEDGKKLERTETDGHVTWTERTCAWGEASRTAARVGDVVTLNGLSIERREGSSFVEKKTHGCGARQNTSADRAKGFEVLYGHAERVRSLTPAFVKELLVKKESGESSEETPAERDFGEIIVGRAAWYVEWPHVDGRFIRLFATLPGMHSSSY